MTTPNYNDPSALDDFTDAANAIGLAAMQQMQAEDWIQAQIDNITGSMGGIVSWVTDGMATIITDVQAYVTTGDTANLAAAAEFVQSKIAGLLDGVVTLVGDLLSALQGDYDGDDETLTAISDFMAGKWLSLAAKATQAALSALQSFVQDFVDAILSAIRKVPVVGGAISDILADVGGLKDDIDTTASGIVDGWAGTGSSTGDVYDTMAAIKSALLNGYTVDTITSSTTWAKPAEITELVVVAIGGGRNGAAGNGDTSGGAGGAGGGFLAQAFDPSTVPSSVAVTIANANGNTSFGALLTTSPGPGGIATQFGYTSTSSTPGNGGEGGTAYAGADPAIQPTPGIIGGSSALGVGGAAGTVGDSGAGGAGGAGGTVATTTLTKCGGGGGGGGGGGDREFTGFVSANGGAGGAGGYPGGGGGGGGGRYSYLGGGRNGAGGAGANGVMWIFTR